MRLRLIVRKFKEGDLIAIMPDFVHKDGYLDSYQYIGQHSPCSQDIASVTSPASDAEYAEMEKHLLSLAGYENVTFLKRKRIRLSKI